MRAPTNYERAYDASCRFLANRTIPTPTLLNGALNRVSTKEWLRQRAILGDRVKTTPRNKMNMINGVESKARIRALEDYHCYKVNGRWRLP